MAVLLFLLFVVAPIAELAVIVQVAGSLGVLNTIGLLVAVSIVGAWLAKREGLGVLRRIQATTARGHAPSREVADGALILLAGALMIAPGFISDAIALLLLIPPTRAVFRGAVLRSISRRSGLTLITGHRAQRRSAGTADVWDAESWEDTPRPRTPGQLRGPS
ncbi:MAG TPA: FxsA family protein [Acidimicrobiales bacterium]|jgi:UPF0716 protein FxsA|nr:FxsA family protein [Acidimicrobiales bacterium]